MGTSTVRIGLLSTCMLTGCFLTATPLAAGAPAGVAVGHSFTWVGSDPEDGGPPGDGHSWTDPRNWNPRGVPDETDAANIFPGFVDGCIIRIDIPDGTEVANLLLDTGLDPDCRASIHGGSLTVRSTLEWHGGTIDTDTTVLGSALLTDEGAVVTERLMAPFRVDGSLHFMSTHVQLAQGGSLDVGSSGHLMVFGPSDISGMGIAASTASVEGSLDTFGDPLTLRDLELVQSGVVDVDGDTRIVLDGAKWTSAVGSSYTGGPLLRLAGSGQADLSAPQVLASELRLRVQDDVAASIAGTTVGGGGTLAIAAPTAVGGTVSLADDSTLVLQAGGSLDGSALYLGSGIFRWAGGRLSGNDVALATTRAVVAGPARKTVADDQGFTSFVQAITPVRFVAGQPGRRNVVDLGGNSFMSFAGSLLRGDVEIRDGTFAASVSPMTIDPGPGRSVTMTRGVQLFSSGVVALVSGTLSVDGGYTVNGNRVSIAAAARLALPGAPLTLSTGTVTGSGIVDGSIVNQAGTFAPYGAGSEPMVVTGDYTQRAGGRLQMQLSADSPALRFGGAVSLLGVVGFEDADGYSPGVGDTRRVVRASAVSWEPSCQETTGSGSDAGHWESSGGQSAVRATFVAGASGHC